MLDTLGWRAFSDQVYERINGHIVRASNREPMKRGARCTRLKLQLLIASLAFRSLVTRCCTINENERGNQVLSLASSVPSESAVRN